MFSNKAIEYIGDSKPINDTRPLVSICITAYQHEDYIEQCIKGALEQTCSFSYEILVGEDDSSDKTRKICKRLARKHPDKIRLFLHDRSNNYKIAGGATGKNNFLHNLMNARGEFLTFCDGDDYWDSPNKIQLQVEALRKHSGSEICFHRSKCINRNENNIGEVGNFGHLSRIVHAKEVIERTGGAMPLASIMVRASLIPHIIKYAYEVPGMHFFIQVLASSLSSEGAVYLPQTMSVYRRNSASSISQTLLNTKQARLEWTMRNLRMLEIVSSLSPLSLKPTFDETMNKIVKKAIASGYIETKSISSLCNKAGIRWSSYGVIKAYVRSFYKRLKRLK